MPVFHTKTIESILEPVAQQVSKLVILHEEADDGSAFPDLSSPVSVVKKAADNLIKVGYETCETSNDIVMRKEMKPALQRVEEACNALQNAAGILKNDSKSLNGKRNLIIGERGILQGVSTILLRFDESEVRKIIRVCNQVYEYLSITEVINKIDDLVVYVKNLTPILTKMTREIDTREKELTHKIHRDLLCQHLDQVKSLTPPFISSMKIGLLIGSEMTQELDRIKANKNYLIGRLEYEINEIIRILQLTTYDEDEWMGDDLTILRQKLNIFEIKLKTAFNWLADNTRVRGGFGEKAIRDALFDARSFADNLDQDKLVQNHLASINSNLESFCVLLDNNKASSHSAIEFADKIAKELQFMHEKIKQITQAVNRYGVTKLAPTIHGKMEQIVKWLINPYLNLNNGVGEQAARNIINECRVLAISQCKDSHEREEFLKQAYEAELLLNKMTHQLMKNESKVSAKKLTSKTSDLNSSNISKQLNEKFNMLCRQIEKCIIQQVADHFININQPIKKLSDLITKPRIEDQDMFKKKYEEATIELLNHTKKLCRTAQHIANVTNQSRNKQIIEFIYQLTNRIIEFTPQVVNSSYILVHINNNSSIREHFDMMQTQWRFMMEHLQKLIDENLDSELFIQACEHSIISETYQIQAAVRDQDSFPIITRALNIVRLSNRIIQVANQEAENSEEMDFVNRILNSNDFLKQCLTLMAKSAKSLAVQPNNKEKFLSWTNSNEKLIDAIAGVRTAVSFNECIDDSSSKLSSVALISDDSHKETGTSTMATYFQIPEFDLLKLNEDAKPYYDSSKQYRASYASRPTPLPDLIEENESDFPLPNSNQPILMAAHDLHININQWCSTDNDILIVAKRITHLMAKLSELVGGEIGTKKQLIATAKKLADEAMEITRIAKLVANSCTNKRIRTNLFQVSERIPTIGTQLKILSTVKATMLGSLTQASKEDEEATEMLIGNAQNLNLSVKATVEAAKSATIKIRTDSELHLKWIRKQ